MPLDLVIFYGSVRHDRQGIRAARFIDSACRGRGHRVNLIDPAIDRLPLLDRMYKEYKPGQAPEVLQKLAGLIKAADAFIIVSGEYNHSIPPALSNCSIISSRNTSGGPRRSYAIRRVPLAGYARRCSCGRCCASWGLRVSRRCSRYPRYRTHSTRKDVRSTTH